MGKEAHGSMGYDIVGGLAAEDASLTPSGDRTYAENVRRADAMMAREEVHTHLSDCVYVQEDRVRVTPLALAAATALAGAQRAETQASFPMPGGEVNATDSYVFPNGGTGAF